MSKFKAFFVALAVCVSCSGSQKVDSKKSDTRLDLAIDFLGKQQFDEAEKEANKALGFDPNSVGAHNILGLVDFFRGMNNFKLVEVEDCLTGVDAEALRQEMDEHFLRADAHFKKAAELEPDLGEAWSYRGSVALQLEQYDDAAKLFDEALKRPDGLKNASLTRANLGWALFHKNDQIGAAKELRQSLQFQPGMCLATYRIGRVYFARQEWEKALERFRDVASKECPIQEAYLYLSKTLAQLGMTDDIPAAVEQCVSLGAKSCVAAQCRASASR